MSVYLDTHVVVWLYDKLEDKFSKTAKKLIEREDLLVSPIVLLELEYLFEIGRISVNSLTIIEFLENRINLVVDESVKPSRCFITSLHEKWTCDPFDRLIVSQAKLNSKQLITKDKKILKFYPHARW